MTSMNMIRKLAVLGVGVLASTAIGCGGGGSCASGSITAEWTVTSNGAAISCTQAGATEVDINVNNMSVTFACDDHVDTTPAVVGGVTHQVSLGLFDSSGNTLSQTQTMGLFVPCGTDVDIGNVLLSIQ
jgi:hypothetical protein